MREGGASLLKRGQRAGQGRAVMGWSEARLVSSVFLRPRENKQEANRGPGAANPEGRLRVTAGNCI